LNHYFRLTLKVEHGTSAGNEAVDVIDQWQYGGFPPVTRMIEGTPISNDIPVSEADSALARRTAGCWGTTGFLRAVLRTVNLPITLVTIPSCDDGVHATPHFLTEGRYLSHGDDPYSRYDGAPFPGLDLMIDESTFADWFGSTLPKEVACKNVGRRPAELAGEWDGG
jgi:hypothetical protein